MTSQNSQGNPWANRLPALILSHVVGTTNVVSVMAMAPAISNDLALSAAQFGTFVSAYYAAQATMSMPAGSITDRFGVGLTLVYGHAVMCIAAITLALADGYINCLGAMFLMGLGYSMTNPSTARGVLDWFPKERRGTAMGLKQVGVPIGGVIAAGNGALAAHIDWQNIMWGVAALMLLNGLYCLSLIRFRNPQQGERTSILSSMMDVIRNRNMNVYAFLNGLLNVGQTNFYGFLTLFLTSSLKTSQEVAGLAIGMAQTASAGARIVWGVISDRKFATRRATLIALICAVAAICMALFALIGPGTGLWITFGIILILGMTIASFAPVAQAVVVESVEPRLAGSAMGVNMFGVHIGGMLGPVLFGWIVDETGGFGNAWFVTSLIVAVGVATLVFSFREGR